MDGKTGKLMTMHKALHPRDDVDRLYESRKGGRGLASPEDKIDVSIQRHEGNIKTVHREIYYSDQKPYRQHKYQQNKNNQKIKLGRKRTV